MAKDISGGDLRVEVLSILRRRRPDLRTSLSPHPLGIEIGKATVFVTNLVPRVAGLSGREREDYIVDFVLEAIGAGRQEGEPSSQSDDFSLVRPHLRVQVIPLDYLEIPKVEVLSQPLSKKARIAYAVDKQGSYDFISDEKLEIWHVKLNKIHEIAVNNLEVSSEKIRFDIKRVEQGAFTAVSLQDGYDASRILLPRFMQRLRSAMQSDLQVAIPTRDFLLAWTADMKGAQALIEMVRSDYRKGPYGRTDEIFIFDDAGLRLADD